MVWSISKTAGSVLSSGFIVITMNQMWARKEQKVKQWQVHVSPKQTKHTDCVWGVKSVRPQSVMVSAEWGSTSADWQKSQCCLLFITKSAWNGCMSIRGEPQSNKPRWLVLKNYVFFYIMHIVVYMCLDYQEENLAPGCNMRRGSLIWILLKHIPATETY